MYSAIFIVLCFATTMIKSQEEATTPTQTNLTNESTGEIEEDLEVFNAFENFLKQFNRTYTNMDQFNKKYEVFKNNYLIKKQLEEEERKITDNKGEQTAFGISQFMDMTSEEFQKGWLNLQTPLTFEADNNTKIDYYFNDENTPLENEDDEETEEDSDENLRFLQYKIPARFDWRLQGAVNPVQAQGICGGCWAFSAVANLEAVYFRKYGVLPKFSEQQLIDCDTSNYGCTGGMMHTAIQYVQSNGIQQSASYPFLQQQSVCRYNQGNAQNFVSGYKFAGTTSEKGIKQMLYESGPLAVTMNANTLQYYTGGVINLPYSQCPASPNHGVNLVGYGNANGVKYWIVRNTWGAGWGEGGYFRIARGRGLCGINQYVVTAY